MNTYILGKKDTHLIFKSSKERELIISIFSFLKVKMAIKYPLDFDKMTYMTLDKIPKDIKSNDMYSINYELSDSKLIIFLTSKFIEVKLIQNPNVFLDEPLLTPFKELSKKADLILIGYETQFYLNDYKDKINKMIQDVSLYPIYLKGFELNSFVALKYKTFNKFIIEPQGIPERILEKHIDLLEL